MSSAALASYPDIYVLIGGPGSGKGTFAQTLLSSGYNYDHISTGDLAREELDQGTEFGLKHQYAIEHHVIGGIPPAEFQALIQSRLERDISDGKGIILDGYPKAEEQCLFLDDFIITHKLRAVFVFLDVDKEEAFDRIQYRETCRKCKEVYNTKFSPPKISSICDKCGSPLNRRKGDELEAIRKRLDEFDGKVQPLLERYGDRLQRLSGMSPLDFHLSMVSSL